MALSFTKAVREKVFIKTLLSGASGSGKSVSALRMATGIARKCDGKIAMIGTESSRDLYYSNEYDYDLLQLEDPFTPEKYMEAIDAAVDAGYKVLIIDSMSHEWKYLNDVHDKMPGNSFQNWGKLKPRHNAFMEKILQAPIHTICTARGKDEWVLEEDDKGKKVPKKVGLGAQQDKNITYEFTVSLMIDQNTHVASTDKDNTHLFDGTFNMITERDGEKLYEWANTGEAHKEKPKNVYETAEISDVDMLKDIKKEIVEMCVTLGGTKNKDMMTLIKEYVPSGNPNAIKSIDAAKELYDKMKNIKPIEQ